MNDVVKKNDQYLARYESDPYAAFANEGGPGIQGKLLTCKKGEWWARRRHGSARYDVPRSRAVEHARMAEVAGRHCR